MCQSAISLLFFELWLNICFVIWQAHYFDGWQYIESLLCKKRKKPGRMHQLVILGFNFIYKNAKFIMSAPWHCKRHR